MGQADEEMKILPDRPHGKVKRSKLEEGEGITVAW